MAAISDIAKSARRAGGVMAQVQTIQELLAGVTCSRPSEGWWCSRTVGHDGPCAARRFPLTQDDLLVLANLPGGLNEKLRNVNGQEVE